ncbi:unnamed protein product, partial [Brenthis ino]
MYHMKNIIAFEEEIVLPKCMYRLKNPIDINEKDTEINICDQKMPNNQNFDLEHRQDKLLQKLDVLYDRIKKISVLCLLNDQSTKCEIRQKNIVDTKEQEEIVIILNSDNLPWFLNIFLKNLQTLNVKWHIHSSVSNAQVNKIKAFFKRFHNLYQLQAESKINIRLIFKCDSTTPELKISSLDVPILGNVNIIRYLCLTYNDIVPYDYENYELDGFLDICHQLENAADKKKEFFINTIFMNNNSSKSWINNNKFSIADLAIFNAIKQLQTGTKNVPQKWLDDCEKIIL